MPGLPDLDGDRRPNDRKFELTDTTVEQIARFVRMTFNPEKVSEFLEIYHGSCERIRAQSGCLHLELLSDVRYPNVMMTYSVWSSEEALEQYRSSEIFRETWSKTRPLFARKPEATSFRRVTPDR